MIFIGITAFIFAAKLHSLAILFTQIFMSCVTGHLKRKGANVRLVKASMNIENCVQWSVMKVSNSFNMLYSALSVYTVSI